MQDVGLIGSEKGREVRYVIGGVNAYAHWPSKAYISLRLRHDAYGDRNIIA